MQIFSAPYAAKCTKKEPTSSKGQLLLLFLRSFFFITPVPFPGLLLPVFLPEAGAKIILITHYPDAPGTALADVVLICGAIETPLDGGSIPVKVAELFVAETLVMRYLLDNRELAKIARDKENAEENMFSPAFSLCSYIHFLMPESVLKPLRVFLSQLLPLPDPCQVLCNIL